MAEAGCVITCKAMLLSYFNQRDFFPDQMLLWDRANGGILDDGRTVWKKLCEAAGGKLRHTLFNDVQPGELVYCIRKVHFGNGHYVLDHPEQPGKIIDPLDGRVKPYGTYRYTGENHYYIGKR
jgi:hypothetical protein